MKEKIKETLRVFVLAFIFSVMGGYAFADWAPPSNPPPGGNTPPPINTGKTTQVREGNFFLGPKATFGATLGLFGQVGIGTLAPTVPLEVVGKIKTTDLEVTGEIKTAKIAIAGKWLLSDTGGGSDPWLRLYDPVNPTQYLTNGGFAADKLWANLDIYSAGTIRAGGKITSASTADTDGGTTVTTKDYVKKAYPDIKNVAHNHRATTHAKMFMDTSLDTCLNGWDSGAKKCSENTPKSGLRYLKTGQAICDEAYPNQGYQCIGARDVNPAGGTATISCTANNQEAAAEDNIVICSKLVFL